MLLPGAAAAAVIDAVGLPRSDTPSGFGVNPHFAMC